MKEKSSEKLRSKCLIFGAISLVILGSINIWGFFYFQKGSSVKSSKFELIDPSRSFMKKQDLIVNFQPLRAYLNSKYESDPDVSVYFEYFSTGGNIAISKDAEFFPASLLKLPVVMAAVKKIENGQWKWENELVLMAGDKDSEFGTLYKSPIGTRFSIEALVSSVLKDSDNTAYFMLLRNIEKEEMQGVWEHLGLQDFVSKDGKISAKRYAVILRSLYNAAFLSEENSNKILKILSESTSAGYIEQGIPKNIPLAHKIGVSSIEQVYMDAGLIYVPNRPYVLIIMTHGKSVEEAKQVMKDISQKTYDYVSGYNDAN